MCIYKYTCLRYTRFRGVDMKIGLLMQSVPSYERIASELRKFEIKHLKTMSDIEELVVYSKPDVVIIDSHIPFIKEAETLLLRYHVHLIYFEGNFESVLEQARNQSIFYEEEEEPEAEKYIPDHSRYLNRINEAVPEETGPRIIYEEKIVEKEIEKILYTSIPSKVIVVGSLYRGAGSTILASNLALMLARRKLDVSYIEYPLVPVPYMFDYLQIHTVEKERPYVDVLRQVAEGGVVKSRKDAWLERGVRWHAVDTRIMPLTSFSYENLLTVSKSLQSSVLIVDISNCWLNPDVQQFLFQADQVLVCVDTDPIKLDRISDRYTRYKTSETMIMDFLLKNEQIQFDMVVMKDHEGSESENLKEILPKKPILTMPYIPYVDIQNALYELKMLYEYEYYQDLFEENLYSVLQNLLPPDFLDVGQQSRKTLLQRLKVKRTKKVYN